LEAKQAELKELEGKMILPNFWDSRESAQKVVARVNILKKVIEPFCRVEDKLEELQIMEELAGEDSSILDDADFAYGNLVRELDSLELVSFLSGKMDGNNAIVSINAGAGGTEACDWAGMVYRMYTHWFEKRGYSFEIIDMQSGDEAGTKSVTMLVNGEFAYGYLKGERGVHRLVRISPFDTNKRRHTSFCAVDVVAEIDDDIEIDLPEADLRFDYYRASGAGGQHVNTTDSAVRITHLPSNIVVTCQNERSQHKNKATALKILKARLYELEQEKRRKEAESSYDNKGDNAWGSQIRSYVLHPYQMVKDVRTHVETSNVSAVLDGDLDKFAEAFLKRIK